MTPRPTRLVLRGLLSLCSLLALPGCFAANGYTTARTLPEGKRELFLASEYVDLQNSRPATESQPRPLKTTTRGGTLLPSVVGMRFGLGPRSDLAVTVHGLGAVHGEIKWQIVSGPIDVAVIPGVDAGFWYEGARFPVLASARLGTFAEIFVSAGVEGVVKVAEPYAAPSGFLLRGGGGIRLNLPKQPDIAVIPEVTYVRNPGSSRDRGLVAGAALVFGL